MTEDQQLQEYIKKGRVLAWLSYMGLLIIIPAVIQRNNPFTVYHVKQGLALIITSIISGFLWFIPQIGIMLGYLSSLALFILNVIGIINAATGKVKPLPLIGKIGESFDF